MNRDLFSIKLRSSCWSLCIELIYTYIHEHILTLMGMVWLTVPVNTSSNLIKDARPNTPTHFVSLRYLTGARLTCFLNARPQGFWDFALQIHIYLHLRSIHLVTLMVYGTSPGRSLHACWVLGLIVFLRVRPIRLFCSEIASHFPQPFPSRFFRFFNKRIFPIL